MRTAWVASVLLLIVLRAADALAQDSGAIEPATPQDAPAESPEISSNAPSDQPPPTAAPQRPVATRQTTFTIPFSVDLTDSPTEVQLLVSADQGKQWSVYLRQRPEIRKFNFRAAGDGEYWFASRTIDSQNRARPEGRVQPELKVIVDTHPPKFELTASASPEGQIKTAWNVYDPNLAPESLKLEYRPASSQTWLPITREPLPFASGQSEGQDTGSRATLTGEKTWMAQTTSLVVDIRGEVRDDAGNAAVATQRVFLERVARRAEKRPAERPAEGLLPALAGLARSPFERNEFTTAPPDPFANRRAAPLNGASTAPGASAAPRAGTNTPPVNTPYGEAAGMAATAKPAPSGPITVPSTGVPAVSASTGPGAPAKSGPSPQEWSPNKPPPDERVADVERYPPARIPTQPPVASRFVSNSAEASTPPKAELPLGERPSMTSARHFDLDYDTESVGPSGVAAVELWGTSDNGRTWTKWGVDADKRSPVRVDVEGDGLYGFCVVVESGIGLAGPRPHSGDPADIWVGVDSAKPQARLTSAIFGTGEFVGQLDIRWEASDDNLKERPVTLLFAEHVEGPWTTIAAGLPNNGRYLWNADPRLARLIYLRLEVRDEAGNVGEHQLAEPISTEGLSPKGRIRGIRPIDDNSQGAADSRVIR